MAYYPYQYWNYYESPSRLDVSPRWILDHMSDHLNRGSGEILELGPGTGRVLEIYSPGRQLRALDLSTCYAARLTERARTRGLEPVQHFLPAPEAVFSLADDRFDLGVCIQGLIHVLPSLIAGLNPEWDRRPDHCFNHDYPAICAAEDIRCRMDAVVFVLRRASEGHGRGAAATRA